jgi:hypothetical protein
VKTFRTLIVDDVTLFHFYLMQAIGVIVYLHRPRRRDMALSDIDNKRGGMSGGAVDMSQQASTLVVTSQAVDVRQLERRVTPDLYQIFQS